jgi:hypothetical protein
MAITKVQHKAAAAAADHVHVILDATAAVGNLIVAAVCCPSAHTGFTPPTNFAEAVWTTAGSSGFVSICYRVAGAAEPTELIATITGASSVNMAAVEFSGTDATPLDKTAYVADTTSSVTSRSSGTTAATTVANELCFAVVRVLTAQTAPSWSNSYTLLDLNGGVMWEGYLVVSSTGAQESTCSWTGSQRAAGLIATFKQATATGGRKFATLLGVGA